MMPLTSSEIEHLASEVAKKAIRELLLTLGVNASDPASALELQADFQHLRQSRLAVAAVKTRAMMVLTGTFVTGLIAAVWLAFSAKGH